MLDQEYETNAAEAKELKYSSPGDKITGEAKVLGTDDEAAYIN